jgi:UDP-N-acetyl-D-mannosaminuronic acid dehydrogenase
MLLAVSRVHESMPLFLVDGLKSRLERPLKGCKVAVLGLTFKRDSDDQRDSLSWKLIRLLERELAHVARHDPYVQSEPLEAVLRDADAIIVATNHSEYDDLASKLPPEVLLVDPWNATGAGEVFSRTRVPAEAWPASS